MLCGSTTPTTWEAVLQWGWTPTPTAKPYGVDVVMPAKVPTEGSSIDINKLIPRKRIGIRRQDVADLGVPPLPEDEAKSEGVLGWLHSVARSHVEVCAAASHQAHRERARITAQGRHRSGERGRGSVAALAGSASMRSGTRRTVSTS